MAPGGRNGTLWAAMGPMGEPWGVEGRSTVFLGPWDGEPLQNIFSSRYPLYYSSHGTAPLRRPFTAGPGLLVPGPGPMVLGPAYSSGGGMGPLGPMGVP